MMNKQPLDKQFFLDLKHKQAVLWILCIILVNALCGCATQQDNHWISLFNGKDLEGWKADLRTRRSELTSLLQR